jgi:hypothetical protein
MKTAVDKYNELVKKIANYKGHFPKAEDFGMNYDEFYRIVNEIEKDGLFNEGYWGLNEEYVFNGLTFKGQSFIENNDKKEYSKIEKTEVNINIGRDNKGSIIVGDNNIINNSKFEKDFNDLIIALEKLNFKDKEILIDNLKKSKNDKNRLQETLGKLLTKGSEVGSIVSMVTSLLTYL